MTQIRIRRSLAAAVGSVALLLPAILSAQSQVAEALPEAPQAQSGDQPTGASSGESTSKAPASNPQPQTAEQKRQQAERDVQAAEKQRLLGIMPQFQIYNGGQAVPLTAGEKWRLASHTAIDPFYIGYALVVGGGFSEIDDSHQGYHWGASGYFKRVGANYADNIDGALIGNGLLPIVLHQDPRYFRLGTGSFRRRFLHAALSTVVCLGDNGHRQPNVSNVLGNFISGAISNAYYPADERGVALTLENGAEVTALGAVGGQLLEFGPDINRLMHHKRKHRVPVNLPTTPPSAPTADSNQTK